MTQTDYYELKVDLMPGFEADKFTLRSYEDGDETEIVKIFSEAYSNYGGYVKRTQEYWRWCCLQRPDVEKEGIMVAFDQTTRKMVGYVVAGKSGSLWELTCSPRPDKEEIVKLLLDNAVSYLKKKETASVSFNAPQADLVITKVCKENGFATSVPQKMFLSVLNLQSLISLIANSKAERLKEKFEEKLLIKIKDAPFWVSDTIRLKISHEAIAVGEGSDNSTIQIDVDYLTFCALLFGNSSSLSAVLHSRLKVKPLHKTLTLLKLLSDLRITANWSFPLSEYG